jgi:hypothetical protein
MDRRKITTTNSGKQQNAAIKEIRFYIKENRRSMPSPLFVFPEESILKQRQKSSYKNEKQPRPKGMKFPGTNWPEIKTGNNPYVLIENHKEDECPETSSDKSQKTDKYKN